MNKLIHRPCLLTAVAAAAGLLISLRSVILRVRQANSTSGPA